MSVDIAGGKGGSGGDFQGRRGDYGGEDRTTGDWRRDGGGDDNDGRGSPPGRDNRDSYGGGSDRRYVYYIPSIYSTPNINLFARLYK